MELLISKNIARLRRDRNLTQDDLATALDVTPQAVSNWERGGYPDITLLPGIANFFGVTIDELMGNDEIGRQEDLKNCYERYTQLETPEERYDLAMEYRRKYPDQIRFTSWAVISGKDIVLAHPELRDEYLPILRELCEKMMDRPTYREYAIRYMTILCEENELDEWLEKAAVSTFFTRRSNLISRYQSLDDNANAYLQMSLINLEHFSSFLDERFLDALGSVKKAEYHRNILTQMDALRTDGRLPDGWLLLYGYKSLVLAACLFGSGQENEGWAAFDTGMGMMKTWFAFPEDAALDLGGGELFGGLKIRKNWYYAVAPDGKEHRLFDSISLVFYTPARLHEFLTDPRWTWFNSVRDDPRFVQAAEWAKSLAEAGEEH